MRKQITTIALGILMLAGVMAMTMYGGETSPLFNTTLNNIVYTVVDNSSDIENLTITVINGTVYASTPLNYKPDNFTLIFFDNTTHIIDNTVPSTHSSGGSRTKYVDRNVTVYVPEYINTTETIEVEVEKVTEKTIYVYEGYELWHVILLGVIGLAFGAWAMSNWKKEDVEENDG